MNNATSFWGTDPGGCPPPPNSVAKTTTCNGSGDGIVTDGTGEIFRFWQHLANAGLIEGSYSGVSADATPYGNVAGITVPRSRLSSAQWSARRFVASTLDATRFAGTYDLNLQLGAVSTYWNDAPSVKAEEAWNIDTKVDDGKPGTGRVIGFLSALCSTAANATDYSASYALNQSAIGCLLQFTQGAVR
ncbi:MAG: hypothetical protein ACOYNL_10090 [Rickettsiales bacterium]